MTNDEAIGVLEDVRDAICENIPGNHPELDELREAVQMAVDSLHERKKGKWIQSEEKEGLEFTFYEIHCSECGVLRKIGWTGANYCPNCGADMRGGDAK